MLDLIPRPLLLVALLAAALFAGVQTLQLASARGDVAQAEREASRLRDAIAVANTEAANKAAALQSQVLKAQNDAKKREATMRAAFDAAVSESDGLRGDVAALRDQLAGASADAGAERALALGSVLAKCAAEHQKLAQRCDRHVDDLRTLTEAWPRYHIK